MFPARETGRGGPRPPDAPRADLVEGCPPHYWVLAAGWQSCKKCNIRQEIPIPEPRRFTYPRRDAGAAKPSPTPPPSAP